MKIMSLKQVLRLFPFFLLMLSACGGSSQTGKMPPVSQGKVGGGCDGCELLYVGLPEHITSVDTSAGWHEPGQKLCISGTVHQSDGRTPAPDVILYYWQTDHEGYYSPRPGMDARSKRHGHIRGWLKTDAAGRYTLYTVRPAPYPDDVSPAHIHLAVKEPDLNEYYVDELVFDDDPLLTAEKRKAMENRGGSGILVTTDSAGMQRATHVLRLGLNIPGYPSTR